MMRFRCFIRSAMMPSSVGRNGEDGVDYRDDGAVC
jgi:hypothetical protein